VRHRPEAPDQRQLVAWLPEADWPEPERLQLEQALAPLADTFGLTLPAISWEHQDDEDWSLSWKQHWEADPVGRRLLILPAWLELPPEHAERLVIRMDPGSAFGTGSHPTTRLCLEAIEQLAEDRGSPAAPDLGPIRVADLGCGSGILGIAAAPAGRHQRGGGGYRLPGGACHPRQRGGERLRRPLFSGAGLRGVLGGAVGWPSS